MSDDNSVSIINGLEWLVNSGIQCMEEDTRGGFAAWYDADTGKYSFIYSEITGYALNLLISFAGKTDIRGLDRSIELATDYLTGSAYEEKFGAAKCRYLKDQGWVRNYCTFDNLMLANALVNKHRLDGDARALATGENILESLRTRFSGDHGFYARYIEAENRYQNDPIKWSTCFGSFHAKMSIAYLNAYDITGNERYLEFVHRILHLIGPKQRPSGQFITFTDGNGTFSHPFCYTVEGFLTAGLYLKDRNYIEVARKALDWIGKYQTENGGFPGYITKDNAMPYDSPDINSQVLRCVTLLEIMLPEGEVDIRIDRKKLVDRIKGNQIADMEDVRINGGYRMGEAWFCDNKTLELGEIKNHVNCWATIFATNALYYLERDSGSSRHDRQFLFTMC